MQRAWLHASTIKEPPVKSPMSPPPQRRPLSAAVMVAFAALAAPMAQAQAQSDDAAMQAVVVSASRSNIEADKAPQTVVIIR